MLLPNLVEIRFHRYRCRESTRHITRRQLLRKSETQNTVRGVLTVTCKNADSINTCMMKKSMQNSHRNTPEALRNPNLERDITEMLRI